MKFILSKTRDVAPFAGARRIDLADWFLWVSGDCFQFVKSNEHFVVLGKPKVAIGDDEKPKNQSDLDALSAPGTVEKIAGAFVIVKCGADGSLNIWTDKFGVGEIYYQQVDGAVYIGSSTRLLPVADDENRSIDQVALMQAMTVYGARPFKKHNLYHDVRRVGVGEKLVVSPDEKISFEACGPMWHAPLSYEEPQALHRYADLFMNAVDRLADPGENWLMLSSGWDSTSILAALVELRGAGNVNALIGRHLYSKRSGCANQFEIDKAKKFADHYGVNLEMVDLDYTDEEANRILFAEMAELFQGNQLFNITGCNHWILARRLQRLGIQDKTVFAGEISDGAHNLGFSQFVSMFHPRSYEFRAYADKMAGYLFGPSFLQTLIDHEQDEDPVWQIMSGRRASEAFEPLAQSRNEVVRQFLRSLFLRRDRMPLVKNTSPLLTPDGAALMENETMETYIEPFVDVLGTQEHYASILELYNSFHWQGGTVATFHIAMEAHNLRLAMPFRDYGLLNYLAYMPEHFGRGLELRPTKFPLKWTVENRLDYPMDLQTGPHSYTYDVDPRFTHYGELVNHSALRPIFTEVLGQQRYRQRLDARYFDMDYVESQVANYLAGNEVPPNSQADVKMLSMLDLLGWIED